MDLWSALDLNGVDPKVVVPFCALYALWLLLEKAPELFRRSRVIRDAEVYDALLRVTEEEATDEERKVLDRLRERMYANAAQSLDWPANLLRAAWDLFLAGQVVIAFAIVLIMFGSFVVPDLAQAAVRLMGFLFTMTMALVVILVGAAIVQSICMAAVEAWRTRRRR